MNLVFTGTPEIRATRESVWQRLLDPHFIAASAPGVESVEVLGPHRFRMHLGFGVALLKMHFDLDVGFHDIVPMEHARMEAAGEAPGTVVKMQSNIRLEELAPRLQRLHWRAETHVDGALAGLGARLVESVARKLTERFWEDFAERAEAAAGA